VNQSLEYLAINYIDFSIAKCQYSFLANNKLISHNNHLISKKDLEYSSVFLGIS